MSTRIDMSTPVATSRFRFGNTAVPALEDTAATSQSSSALKLLIVFLLLMYSSIGVIYPATEVFRPVMVVAIGAILCAILEVSRSGKGFRIS